MKSCLLCKKFGKESGHPTSACILFHGVSGDGGRVASSKVPQEYRYTLATDLSFKKEMFEAYVESFKKMFMKIESTKDRIKSLYLWSEATGTGKTTTASALLNEYHIAHVLLSWKEGRKPDEYPTFFIDVNELQELYNRFNRQGIPQDVREEASREYYRRIEIAKKASLVAFDDIGLRNATEGFRGDLHTVVNYRTVQQLPSIYTSNLPLQSMSEIYDHRLYDRMRDLTVQVEFTGDSFRGLR
jgi:DNA replication protein DnaC